MRRAPAGGRRNPRRRRDAHGVLTCSRETPLSRVAELMGRHRVHSGVVTDDPEDAGSLWGVVSDLDLVAAASVRELADQMAPATAAGGDHPVRLAAARVRRTRTLVIGQD